MSNETLNYLLVSTAEISMKQFDANLAVNLQWNDTTQRPVPKLKVPASAEELNSSDDFSSSSDSENMHLLSDWDNIVCDAN